MVCFFQKESIWPVICLMIFSWLFELLFQYFKLQVYLIDVWKDDRLNTSRVHPGSPIQLSAGAAKCIWTPDLIFDNSKEGNMFPLSVPNMVVSIHKNKTVIRKSRYSFKVRCPMVVSYSPGPLCTHFHLVNDLHFPSMTRSLRGSRWILRAVIFRLGPVSAREAKFEMTRPQLLPFFLQ